MCAIESAEVVQCRWIVDENLVQGGIVGDRIEQRDEQRAVVRHRARPAALFLSFRFIHFFARQRQADSVEDY